MPLLLLPLGIRHESTATSHFSLYCTTTRRPSVGSRHRPKPTYCSDIVKRVIDIKNDGRDSGATLWSIMDTINWRVVVLLRAGCHCHVGLLFISGIVFVASDCEIRSLSLFLFVDSGGDSNRTRLSSRISILGVPRNVSSYLITCPHYFCAPQWRRRLRSVPF